MKMMLFLGVLLLPWIAEAHEGCGGTISGMGQGLLVGYRNNRIGLNYSRLSFQAKPAPHLPRHLYGTEYDFRTTDVFHIIELQAQFYVRPRIRLSLFLPYRVNDRQESRNVSRTKQGLSDVRLMANYIFWDNKSIGNLGQIYWELGAGLRLPTGSYDPNLQTKNLPDNFNLGNGGWGYLTQSSMVFKRKQLGISINASHQWIPPNRSNYSFGNQTTFSAMIFWEQDLAKHMKVIPSAGVYYEHIRHDIDAVERVVAETGGKGTFLTAGLDVLFDNLTFSIQTLIPTKQSYSDDVLTAQSRINLNFSYLLKRK